MLKKFVSLFLLVSILFCMGGCGSNSIHSGSSKDDNNPEYSQNGETVKHKNVSLRELTSTGEISYDKFLEYNSFSHGGYKIYTDVRNIYESVTYDDYVEYLDDGFFPFIYNEKVGYADAYGNVVIANQYKTGNFFSEGKAFILDTDDKWKVIDKSGNKLFTVPDGYECFDVYFQNGKAILRKDERISLSGGNYEIKLTVLVITDEFKTNEFNASTIAGMGSYSELLRYTKIINTPEFSGILTKKIYDQTVTYTLYNTSGKEIWNTSGQFYTYESDDPLGKCLCDALSIDIASFTPIEYAFRPNNGYMNILGENEKWGLLDLKTGNIVIPCKYDYVGEFSNGVAPVCNYGKWGYVDLSGNETLSPTYKYTGSIKNGYALAITEDDKLIGIDKTGKVISTYDVNLQRYYKCDFSYEFDHNLVLFVHGDLENAYLLNEKGDVILRTNDDCDNLYLSNKYLFANGRMYEIVIE